MAFSATNMTPLGTGNGFTLWHYKTTDAIAAVNSSAYFNDYAEHLNVRDVIIVCDTNTPTTNFVNVLSISASNGVDVSDGTAIVETDGD